MKIRFTLVLLLAAFAFGCGDNAGNPAGFTPNGYGDSALLLLDVQPATADSSEVVVYGEIYDASSANGFRLYMDPAGQGYRPAADYLAAPTKTFSTGVNGYRIRALDFDPTVDNVFLGRGARNGLETTVAPLTEHAVVNRDFAPIDLARRLDVTLVAPADSAFLDSNTFFQWEKVPGAARYRFYVTDRNGIVFEEIIDAKFEDVMVIENRQVRSGLLHWGLDAIDVQNRVIGITRKTHALLL
jgi:hypothetical protein